MEKVRVRYVIKPGKVNPDRSLDRSYEFDPDRREYLSQHLEKKLENSLNELEKALKKTNLDLDI